MKPSTIFTIVAVGLGAILIIWTTGIGYYNRDLPVLLVLAIATVGCGVTAGRLKDRSDFGR